ncbi:MFS transporter [Rhodophyticola sp. CCM32]|uniref:MFS transporter n=1 Tax=Rhodophyticola sp. CCM32 TaxID=2916397 RepID=UPI00107F21FF|nr:MFS transporter [Rhodophyticola sp. CCM32]QBY00858.1 MFS transporter [Rhodophyticola sp. CCM32]
MSVLSALRLSHAPVAGFVSVGLVWGCFAAQVPVIKAHVGAGDALFGVLLLGTSIGLLSTMWIAPWMDRRLGTRAMPVAAICLAAVFVLPGLAGTPLIFFMAMLLAGLGSGLLDVVMNARVSELEARHGRSLMNANHAMFSVAYAFAAILTGLGRELALPTTANFAVVSLLIILLSTRMRMPVEPVDHTARKTRRFPWPVVLICGAIVLLAFFVEASVEAWSALHIERTLGGRAAEGAFGPAILGLTMAIGRFSGQAVSEQFSEQMVIVFGTVMASLGAMIAATATSPALAYLGFGTMGLGISVVGPMGLALLGRSVAPEQRTAAISRGAVIGFAGFVLAPAVMGLISGAFGLRIAFVMVGLLALGTPLLTLLLKKQAGQTG